MNPEGNKNTVDLTKLKNSLGNSFSSAIFYLAILFFIIGFNFSDVMIGNWYQQFLPNLGTQYINDITFLDSLRGFAVASRNVNPDTSSILRTTNGGDNWQIIFTQSSRRFSRVKFINSLTGYISGGSGSGTPYFYKSTNSGDNWVQMPITTGNLFWNDMALLNEDTLLAVDDNGFNGGVYRSINGGSNWSLIFLGAPGILPNKIYMYNKLMGFLSTSSRIYRTTDGGFNWTLITGESPFFDMYFVDSLTGWKANDTMKKTTDGGISWQPQQIPRGPNISFGIYWFSNINSDTIWGSGGVFEYPNLQDRGILYRTTNGGNNWLFQIPDTSIKIYSYVNVDFYTKLIGWAYGGSSGIHTTTGGDTTFYLGIVKTNNVIPKDFELKQNYPNPFNPRTVIPYKLKKSAYVRLIAYEITGKETQIMVDQHQEAGEYEVDFIGKFAISSGVYFYRIEVTDDKSKQIYTETKKMILIK